MIGGAVVRQQLIANRKTKELGWFPRLVMEGCEAVTKRGGSSPLFRLMIELRILDWLQIVSVYTLSS